MDIDTSAVDQARERAETAEHQAAEARAGYYRSIADLVRQHGASAAARALGITRARVYQLIAKLDDDST